MKSAPALLLLVVAAMPASAQDGPDAAHRADARQTRALNTRSASGYAQARTPPRDQDDYDRARAEYRQRLAAWRARVAACEAGRTGACE